MGLLGIDSTSSQAIDNRVAATDQARVNRGNVGQLTEAGGLGVGAHGTVQAAGSVNVSGRVGNTGGNTVDTGNGGTVVVNDPAAALAALDSITQVSQQAAANQAAATQAATQAAAASAAAQASTSQAAAASNAAALQAALDAQVKASHDNTTALSSVMQNAADSNKSVFDSALSQITGLATSAQTGGASAAGKTFQWILLGGMAIVGLVLVAFFWRKH